MSEAITQVKTYAVIGHPIEHSLSPTIHKLFAEQTGLTLNYIKIDAPINGFIDTVKHFIEAGGCGANVTVPFKTQAYELANKHSDAANIAQAANTLVFKKDGSIFADTTDGIGLVQDLTHNHHYVIRQKRILILGAGGAVQSILGGVLQQAPRQVVVANRTKAKADALVERFQMLGQLRSADFNDIGNGPFDLIIHGTSLGLQNTMPSIPSDMIGPSTWCYDLNYAEKPTAFLQWAQQQGAEHTLDGIGMLVEQAAASFYLWHGVYPDTQPIIAHLLMKK